MDWGSDRGDRNFLWRVVNLSHSARLQHHYITQGFVASTRLLPASAPQQMGSMTVPSHEATTSSLAEAEWLKSRGLRVMAVHKDGLDENICTYHES